jgi:hypothetical protein
MRKSRIALVVAWLLIIAAVHSSAAAGSHQRATEWIVLAPAGEGFSVSLPVKPEEQTDRIPMMGNTYKMRLYTSVDEASGLLYMVIMQEFPPLSGLVPAARLEKFMEGFKGGLNQSIGNAATKVDLLPDRDLDLKGHVGRQYKLSFGETRGLVRAFDGSPRMYVVLVMGADEKNSSVGRFFDSFEIKPAPAPVSQPVTETKP